jgi:hypothetical protein
MSNAVAEGSDDYVLVLEDDIWFRLVSVGKVPHLGSSGEVVIFLKPAVHSDLYRDQH